MSILYDGESLQCPICGEGIVQVALAFNVEESVTIKAIADFKVQRILSATTLPRVINLTSLKLSCPYCNTPLDNLLTDESSSKFKELALDIAIKKGIINKEGEEN